MAELSILRVFNKYPGKLIVYIAPLKALAKERLYDWEIRFGSKLGKKVHELTGDFTPDLESLMKADIVITTPEKWDGISRSWNSRAYVKKTALVIFDEIHLLG
jgi:activating signal cointegrator complex subunit 3